MKKLPAFAAFLIVVLFAPGFSAVLATSEEEQEARERLEQINEDRAVLQQRLNALESSQDLASDELADIDRDLNVLQTRRERTAAQLARKRAQVELLNQSHAQAVEDLKAAQERFERRLVEWYKSGSVSVLGSLLSKGNLSDFIYAMAYTQAVIENDRNTIDFIRQQQARIFQQKEQLDAEIAECERLLASIQAQEAQYTELQQRRLARLNEIANDVRRARRALEELEQSSYEIRMMLQVAHYTGNAGGRLLRPIDAPITSGFGMRRHPILHVVRMHTGVDMPAPAGTPIHAAAAGYVVFSGWKRGYGYCVTIDHGGGLATLYAHCSQLLVNQGETVSRNQVIAKVGTTGLSTGNHLHFEVRINGEPVDPTPYIGGQ